MSKADIVKSYIERYKDTPSLTLAKALASEFHDQFESVEAARDMIRYYRGARGQKSRDFMPEHNQLDWKTVYIHESPAIVASDLHIPYHSLEAIDIMLDRAAEMGVRAIIFNGDVLDFYQASYFCRDPKAMPLHEEMDLLKDFMHYIQCEIPGIKIYYKLGNHERRWETLIRMKVPELAGFQFANVTEMFQHELHDITVIGPAIPIQYGKLAIIHGHEYGAGYSSPVNPARLLFLKAKKSVLCGHYHQISAHQEPTIAGDMIGAWSIGCMCDLHPEYAPLNKWGHGFAELYLEDNGNFYVKNRSVIDHKLR